MLEMSGNIDEFNPPICFHWVPTSSLSSPNVIQGLGVAVLRFQLREAKPQALSTDETWVVNGAGWNLLGGICVMKNTLKP